MNTSPDGLNWGIEFEFDRIERLVNQKGCATTTLVCSVLMEEDVVLSGWREVCVVPLVLADCDEKDGIDAEVLE